MLADTRQRFRALTRNARLYLISNTLQAVTAGASTILYTLYLASLGYGTQFIGLVLVTGTIGGGLGIIPASPLAARLGWKRMLLISDFVGGIAVAVQLVLPVPPVIFVTTLGIGASVAFFLVVNAPFLAANSTLSERTALFGLNNALAYLAAVAGSLLGGFLPGWLAHQALMNAPLLDTLLVHGDRARVYELSLLIAGAISVPSVVPVLMMREDEAGREPHVAPALLGGDALDETLPSSEAEKHSRLRRQLAQALARVREVMVGVVGRFSVTQALIGFGAGLFFPYVNLYVVNQLHATTGYFGVLNATLTVLLAVAALVSVPLADWFGKVRVSVIATLCSVPFLLTLGAFPVLWIVSIAYLARSFLANLSGTPLQAYLMEAVPQERRVVASGVYNVSFQLAGAAGAGLGGILIAALGFRSVCFIAAPFYVASAVLLAFWFGVLRQK